MEAIKNLVPTKSMEDASARESLTIVNVAPQINVTNKRAPSPEYFLLKF